MKTLTNQEILNILNYRYACKKFDDAKKISQEDFQTILEAARLSPTSCGLDMFKVLVIQDEELRQKLLPLTPGGQKVLPNASHFVVLLANKMPDIKADSDYVKHMLMDIHHFPEGLYQDYIKGFEQFGTQLLPFMDNERTAFDWASKQTYIVLGNMLTIAASMGIDSTAIEGFDQKAVENLLGKEEGLFDTDHYGVSVMAAFGYRGEEPHRAKTRRPMEEVVLWK